MRRNKILYIAIVLFSCLFLSCSDFLDGEPLSDIPPESYYSDASQLETILNELYPSVLPSHTNQWNYGIYQLDNETDNQVEVTAGDKYTTDRFTVPSSGGNNWNFDALYHINFFFGQVIPKYGEDVSGSQNTITGELSTVQHYIGEMYFLRAYWYFTRLQDYGDFPIITEPMTEDRDFLIEKSKRRPRNEVARFILKDLDLAIRYLSFKDMATTRINKDVALLLKSRVGLFEGTWLKYFKGTPFVPNGPGWPGATKDYNANYSFPSGSIDSEITFFLTEATEASKVVADKYKTGLTVNTGKVQQTVAESDRNPFHDMFASVDLSGYSEVLLWREYGRDLSTHNVNLMASRGNFRVGVTRGLVNSFLMADGTPIYTHGDYAYGDGYYMGDTTISAVCINRDSRLSVFLKCPDQKNILYNLESLEGDKATLIEPIPSITLNDNQRGYSTGFALRKGGSFDKLHYNNGGGFTASVGFRAAEALLNYIESSYELTGALDGSAIEYWKALRDRARVNNDINATIASTDMNEEAANDWGAYSAGQLIDPTLYNIRRERRCEFMAEGLRKMDLYRWRSLDQLKTTPYHIEGIHLWNTPMEHWDYTNGGANDPLFTDGTSNSNVSSESVSEYLRPHERYSAQAGYNGLTWMYAHYLSPIKMQEFQVTASSGSDVSTSPLYQNPYWEIQAGSVAKE